MKKRMQTGSRNNARHRNASDAAFPVTLIIAMHKEYPVPDDELYLPVQVGAKGKTYFTDVRDNDGDNISEKNDTFSELTGLYYAWKNLPYEKASALGLVHYRRYFCGDKTRHFKADKQKPWQIRVLTEAEAKKLLARYDVLVPKKRHYYIETLYNHYSHTLDGAHLDLAKTVISELAPDYLPYVDRVYQARSGYFFNMYLMKRELSDAYCAWLFPILFEMEKRFDTSGLSAFEKRVYGRVSEILFNVWLFRIKETEHIRVHELPYLYTEHINWLKKGTAFLLAKFFGKKYGESF